MPLPDTDPQYSVFASLFSTNFRTPVKIRKETVSGAEVICVYSHGHRSMMPFCQMPPVSHTGGFGEAIRQMVDANYRAAYLPPRIVTEPWMEET